MSLYKIKQEEYFTRVRHDLVSLMPKTGSIKVLEIGSGGGDTLVYLKHSNRASEVVGVDVFKLEGTNQDHELIDQFIIADIENQELDLEKEYFDAIICGDVLEHLVDPWTVLSKVEKFLKPGGQLIVSVPNIRFYKVLYKIIFKGDFQYDPLGGVLDKTHLRFFCKKNLVDLVSLPNFKFELVTSIQRFPGHPMSWKVNLFNKLTLMIFDDFFASQFIAVSKKEG
ncbi:MULTISPECIES: class I SAM-dependent methyltransferase [Spirosoma]|nr:MULTISPECIES: class I SAM-dependent methyltransferase [Spirosoma]